MDDGVWLSLARAPGLGPGGRRFESCHPDSYKYARVAQLVERDLAKVEAAGSSPVSRSFYFQDLCGFRGFRSPLLIYIELLKVFTEGFVLSFRICLLEEIQETKKNEGKCVIFLIFTCMYTLPVI